jgi:hypothetical protein
MTPIGHLDRLKPAHVARVAADCPGCHTGFNANASASGRFSNNTASGRYSNAVCVASALAGRASPKSAMEGRTSPSESSSRPLRTPFSQRVRHRCPILIRRFGSTPRARPPLASQGLQNTRWPAGRGQDSRTVSSDAGLRQRQRRRAYLSAPRIGSSPTCAPLRGRSDARALSTTWCSLWIAAGPSEKRATSCNIGSQSNQP